MSGIAPRMAAAHRAALAKSPGEPLARKADAEPRQVRWQMGAYLLRLEELRLPVGFRAMPATARWAALGLAPELREL